jgi:uncharacterized protein (TIGR03083 family)
MDASTYIEAIERDGSAVADVARRGLDAPVPSCPGWDVGDLVGHLGEVYAFVALVVERLSLDRPPDQRAPGRGDLIDWYAACLGRLLTLLREVPPDAPMYNWSLEPKTARFWPRRMALETLVHRWDADSAYGDTSPMDPRLAADGIDEVLRVWKPVHRMEEEDGPNGTAHFHCTDTEGEWLVSLEDRAMSVSLEHGKGDAAVRGPAQDLLLALWGRRPFASLETFGDRALLDWCVTR